MRSSTVGIVIAIFAILTLSTFFTNNGHHEHGHGGNGNHPSGPHGGALVVLGEQQAHLEILFDSAKGEVVVYVLGSNALESRSLKQREIEVRMPAISREGFKLSATQSVEESEGIVWRSPFTLTDQRLIDVFHLDIEIVGLVVDGVGYPPLLQHLH